MGEQLQLIEVDENYSLVNLKDSCYTYVKKKYPAPIECEEYEDYLKMLKEEADLEFADRLRKLADKIEKRIYEPQNEQIKETYRGMF